MKRDVTWILGRYAVDVHKHLLSREKKMMKYQKLSTDLSERSYLVEYMAMICDMLGFCRAVKHLAIYYLDMFMDNYSIEKEHMCLIAVGCLIVAVKVDEQTELIPKISHFNMILGNSYQPKEIIEIEASIMEFFNWDLLLPTPATYIDYYSLYAIRMSDLDGTSNARVLKRYAQKYIDYLMELILRDHQFRFFRPSVVAASCVAVSRKFLDLTPIWPYCLENVTQCKYSDIKSCVELMLQNYAFEAVVKQEQIQSCDLSTKKIDDGTSNSQADESNCPPPVKQRKLEIGV